MNVYIPGTGFATQGPCDKGFHVPTATELGNIYNIWTALGGGSSDGDNLRIYLKLPYAGYRGYSDSSSIGLQGTAGYYWSSTININFKFNSSSITPNNTSAIGFGFSIRAFKDIPVTPTSSWTKLYGTSIESGGIFWSSTDGLISLSSDGTNWITISDKNVGATTVWNSGDTLSETNCGKYYQQGNNYGFAWTGSVTASSTQVNASTYGPGNYYSSSIFITGNSGVWESSNNSNLRGGEDGNVQVMSELKKAYIGEYIEPQELCFTANTANSTVQLTKTGTPTSVTLETSSNGMSWSTYTIGDTITLSNVGDRVYWRNTSTTDTLFGIDTSNYYKFVMTGSIAGSGDVNYLLNKNSTTTISSYCYYSLFYNCTSLTSAPELPSTTLAQICYGSMFKNCTSLTTTPSLPATTLANSCYSQMFNGCTGLTSAPSLPATTLAQYCYRYMFQNCTSLTTLPKLPATTLVPYCYNAMFNNCSKIKLYTSQTGEYQTSYRIPTTGTGTTASYALDNMFASTGGTFTGAPSINITYYTSNTVV